MKVKLLKQLSTGFKTPPQAKEFITLLLDEYNHLSKVARKMTGLLKELVCMSIAYCEYYITLVQIDLLMPVFVCSQVL